MALPHAAFRRYKQPAAGVTVDITDATRENVDLAAKTAAWGFDKMSLKG
jgi:hypothetical protein